MKISWKQTMLCLVMLLITLVAREANATDIGYGAMQRDTAAGCSPLHPGSCKEQEVNQYSRGCELGLRCRGQSAPTSKEMRR
ncbi:hypothetical protein P3X46_006736 [Hevea brasiliensis]|uniref:Uncharacterized protein n=1 Tax=Hevea brasiliensis TaxID=3981 RepID=A0ABQ9MV02_HEVBR|nr:hypothetical protein P3X46_006736 [Hevea brasiliensis]